MKNDKKTDYEIYIDWVKENFPNDDYNNPEYRKAITGTVMFQMYLLRLRMKVIFNKVFSSNETTN